MARSYAELTDGSKVLRAHYRSSLSGYQEDSGFPEEAGSAAGPGDDDSLVHSTAEQLTEQFLAALATARPRELERGLTLVGPHRDEVELVLGNAPAKGYASHGETWSVALSLRLASYYVLKADQELEAADPILILDDVFAELDAARRSRLAGIVAAAEQVLVTAAVAEDVPEELSGARIRVSAIGVVDG